MRRQKDPRILVFDSGLGGLSVLSSLIETIPYADYVFLADDARFPYGDLSDEALTLGLVALLEEACSNKKPDIVVIACNTASTVALSALRARFSMPIVGIVPAIKPAANATRTGHIGVLATPGTISRAYTRDLIRDFAQDCKVKLVACEDLAGLAEAFLLEGERHVEKIASEIATVIAEPNMDTVVLGCTHYPLLLPILRDVMTRPVLWIDPAPAVARRVMHVLEQEWQDCVVPESGSGTLGGAHTLEFRATAGGEKRLSDAWDAILQMQEPLRNT